MIDSILILISALLIVLNLNNFYNIIVALSDCLFRWKSLLSFEENIHRSYARNLTAGSLIIPFCLIASRYFPIHSTIAYLLLTFSYILIQRIAYLLLLPARKRTDSFKTANKIIMNFFILMMVIMLITVAVFYLIKPEELIAQHILIAIFILFFLNYIVRKFQILLSESSAFTTILYLCTLDLIPLAAIALYFIGNKG